MFPPGGLVTPWVRFKVMSTGVNIARRLWDQREDLREAYETVHGSDPAKWPTRHPGIVIDIECANKRPQTTATTAAGITQVRLSCCRSPSGVG
jgi:hypothetical protein